MPRDLNQGGTPVVSVIIVSDYASGDPIARKHLERTLAALAVQDFDEAAEFLFVERDDSDLAQLTGLSELLPGLKVVRAAGVTSYDLQNAGAHAAAADIVALLDADCVPDKEWLRVLVQSFRRHPEIAVVSGLTTYPGSSSKERILALVDRAIHIGNRTSVTDAISNNNSGYRRRIMLEYPLSNDAGPFGARLQVEAIRRDGHKLLYEPGMRVRHAFEGWAMVRDIRRHQGYAVIAVRRADRRIRMSRILGMGIAAVPAIVAYRTVHCWWRCLRARRVFGVAWYELPVALGLAAVLHTMEASGMIMAYRNHAVDETAYR